ncbi:hypothetical protein AMTR_s00090p00103720 [Amborella trichopoda]|uniref:Uncharacterized protein n=1 Tax=Amborella trichopoda TaxID=13333 RepID=W1P247_AMBTC|nr:hypothetical protein AMTR_s00090p00103720 [Amborella trichopoda]
MTKHDWVILNTMKSMSIGAKVMSLSSSEGECELMYMRARFKHKVGSKDTESYNILNPNGSGGYELNVFFIRSGEIWGRMTGFWLESEQNRLVYGGDGEIRWFIRGFAFLG